MADHNEVARFLIEEVYQGDVGRAVADTGFAAHQIKSWIDGTRRPHRANLRWLMHGAFVPVFKIITEYAPIDGSNQLRATLKKILGDHWSASGIYAFYDSMANLVYVGKSDGKLGDECYQQLNATLASNLFPRGIKQPTRRRDVVRYVSAYFVKGSDFDDHAKHVESLILRLSKPRMNKNIGSLETVDN